MSGGRTGRVWLLVLLPLVIPIAAEITLALVRHAWFLRPSGSLLQTARLLYVEHRDTIQYLPECAQYDPTTSYVLRPGECRFTNDEFSTVIRANRLGLRDDEQSLVRPEIVVLGDSYAMGWGVEQDETFASLIEKTTGLRVLNAAISSYGTARELMLLSRIDTSAMRYLVIQYAGNDYAENLAYLQNDGHLEIMSRAAYEELVRQHERRRSYYPGMYLTTWLRAWRLGTRIGDPGTAHWHGPISIAVAQAPTTPQAVTEAGAFLDVLARSPVPLDNVQLIVLAMACPRDFVPATRQLLEDAPRPEPLATMKMVHLDPLLSKDDYFRLDDHLRPRGHAVVAENMRRLLGF